MIKKKGLSTVVTTLIIILLVLVAIGIIWIVIANLVEEGSEQIFLDKFTTDLKIKNVNVDNSTNYAEIDVKRNVGKGDLTGIKFIFNDGLNSETFEITSIVLQELGEKRFNFTLTTLNIDDIQTISIAPLYRSNSGKIITGGIIATYRLRGAGVLGTCTPDCNGLLCGSDGCGGTCGTCGTGYHCSVDQTQCLVDTASCDLTSASWSALSVVDGTQVFLNLQGTDCDGKDISFELYEDDLVSDDLVPTSPTNPANITFSGTSSNGIWTSSWTYTGDDDIGTDPRDYYFIAYVVGESESITSSGGTLAVSQGTTLQTCSEQGGTVCFGAETCSGTILTASDSDRCCSVVCSAPVTSLVYRDFSTSTVSPGGTVYVNIYIYVMNGDTYYGIDEYLPSGWTWIDADGGNTTDPQKLSWADVDFGGNPVPSTIHTYTVQAPTSTGAYTFTGEYGFETLGAGSGITYPTQGDTTLTVA